MNKIILLGSNSNVAKDLIKYLINDNELYLIYRNNKKQKNKTISNVFELNFNDINKIKYKKFDLIINCVATHEFSKKKKLIDYVNSNILTFINFLNTGIKSKKIINLSTISKLDLFNNNNITEECRLNNSNLLGLTKSTLDKLLKFQNIPNINLLLPGVITRDRKIERPYLKKLLYDLKNKSKIEIFNPHFPFNSFIDTYELYKFINFILIKKKLAQHEEYIFCPSGSSTIYKIIKKFEIKYDKKIKIKNLGNNNNHYLLNNSKLKKKLKFNPSKVDEILKRII